ncbi:MAG: hypothetical protein V1849_02590 [Chloroflexota bacterium]
MVRIDFYPGGAGHPGEQGMLGGALLDLFPTHPLYIWGTICVIALAAAVGFARWGTKQIG